MVVRVTVTPRLHPNNVFDRVNVLSSDNLSLFVAVQFCTTKQYIILEISTGWTVERSTHSCSTRKRNGDRMWTTVQTPVSLYPESRLPQRMINGKSSQNEEKPRGKQTYCMNTCTVMVNYCTVLGLPVLHSSAKFCTVHHCTYYLVEKNLTGNGGGRFHYCMGVNSYWYSTVSVKNRWSSYLQKKKR